MASQVLTLINNCTEEALFGVVPNNGPPFLVVLLPGQSEQVPLINVAFLVITEQNSGAIFSVVPDPNATITFQPGPNGCVLGDGPIPLRITNQCAEASVTVIETDAEGGLLSIAPQTIPAGGFAVYYVRADTTVIVSGPNNVLEDLHPGTNFAERFLDLAGPECLLMVAPGTGTITITNACRFDAVATVQEVAGGVSLPGLNSTLVIPAGTSVTYTFQSIATTLAQVCLGGRCVTVAEDGLVSLVETSGFCAPSVGPAVRC